MSGNADPGGAPPPAAPRLTTTTAPPPYIPERPPLPADAGEPLETLAWDFLTELQSLAADFTNSVKEWVLQRTSTNENAESLVTGWIVTVFCVVITLVLVILFVLLGWYIVWTCFLSRFKFVRELLMGNNNSTNNSTSPSSSPQTQTQRRSKSTYPVKKRKSVSDHYD